MSDEYDHTADLQQQIDPTSIYNRILAATLGNPGDDVEQGQAVMALALELSAHIAALEAVRDAAAEVVRNAEDIGTTWVEFRHESDANDWSNFLAALAATEQGDRNE